MLVRSTPCDGGVVTNDSGGSGTAAAGTVAGALAGLLSVAPATGQDLPCLQGDADMWFAESPSVLEEAKSRCADCPIRVECLDGALSRGEPWGVWGGEIFERGRVIPRKRPRGRPRKADLERDRAWALAAGA